ncbi:LysR family transcriptional regulator, partial [Salmonella enterica subsp. enterica serovar Infantis]
RPGDDTDLVTRVLADRRHRPFARPELLARTGSPSAPAEWSHGPGLSLASGTQFPSWELYGPQGARAEVHFTPRMFTTDMLALRE